MKAFLVAAFLIILEQNAVIYEPNGTKHFVPAGSEIELCVKDNTVLSYDLLGKTFLVPQPCPDTRIFKDGFEGIDFLIPITPITPYDMNTKFV